MNEIQEKIKLIRDVWNNYILEYKLCASKIRFSDDIKTNYIGIIFGYFEDTLDIIYSGKESSRDYIQTFSYHISLLQTIYVQQDLIQEMLFIFKCKIDKGDLKQNENYSINREIRNELIGHPIRKENGNGKLISASLFGYETSINQISYLKYHVDNNHNFEAQNIKTVDIINRHQKFTNYYLDKILQKISAMLIAFVKDLNKVESQIYKQDFKVLINILKVKYESIFNYDNLYLPDEILEVYNLKDKHYRYSNFINLFYSTLHQSIIEKKKNAIEIINSKFEKIESSKTDNITTYKNVIKFINNSKKSNGSKSTLQKNYNYELGKLATKRNYHDFEFFSGLIKVNFNNNEVITEELENMSKNHSNDIEYYCSLALIRKTIES
ncbi:hypothetical protein GWA97_08820 [Flavobacterium sp. LaA7.5]|nr:hypothetical protein [Flavobacterium salilacus subsp. altitudinum]